MPEIATMPTTRIPLTSSQVCLRLGAMPFGLRAILAKNLYPEPQKIGGRYIFWADELPAIREVMILHGYLKVDDTPGGGQ